LRSGGAIPASEVDKTAHAILNDVNGGKGELVHSRPSFVLTLHVLIVRGSLQPV
jgi:hypothetical protein